MTTDCRRLTARYSYAKAAFPRRFLPVGCRRMQMCAAWHSVVRSSVRQNAMNFVTETNNAVIAARGGTFSATVFFSGERRTEYHLITDTACIHFTANGCTNGCKVSIALSVPILLYGFEVCNLCKRDLYSLDFVVNRFL